MPFSILFPLQHMIIRRKRLYDQNVILAGKGPGNSRRTKSGLDVPED
jgi:hypothetical protein